MRVTIEQGDEFVCLKNVRMIVSNELKYIKGYVYKSDNDGCITNCDGNKFHQWDCGKVFKKHFLYLK
jgi:hypothetical protein